MKSIKTMSVKETGELLSVSTRTVYNMIEDGRLTSYRKGNSNRGNPHNITLDSVIDNIKR
ncbi:MAG: DNA-binding protein [Pelagibacteraceae bacterium TMED247]|jgi:excisionase family DNA binding protein|nr:MAG: DNA-binding protein [Pelagibacteraceae bacterium TMED247]